MPVTLDESIPDKYRMVPQAVMRDGMIITDNCKNPDKAFELLEFVCSEEAQKRLMWGTEGVTYNADAQTGKFSRTQEQINYLLGTDVALNEGLASTGWPKGAPMALYEDGNYWSPSADPAIQALLLTDVERTALSRLGVSTFSEMFATPVATLYGQAWDVAILSTSDGYIANEDARTAMRLHHPDLVKAVSDSAFNIAWTAFENDVRVKNHYKYANEIERLIKERADAWYGTNFSNK
jgi:putative aldouronate transport system substrate-binding protein